MGECPLPTFDDLVKYCEQATKQVGHGPNSWSGAVDDYHGMAQKLIDDGTMVECQFHPGHYGVTTHPLLAMIESAIREVGAEVTVIPINVRPGHGFSKN